MSITAEQITQFINNFKAVGIVAKPADIASALKKVDKDKQCQVYDADREQHVGAVIRFALVKIYKNAEWLMENDVDDEFKEVLKSIAVAYVKEEYMGININRVLVDLSTTPFESTVVKLKDVIDSFAFDQNVIEAYNEYVGFDASEEDDDDAQAIQGDLEFNYRCALLDRLKDGLRIPLEIDNDPDDTHTVCYDAINEYDENLLVDKDTQNMLEDMASEKFNVEIDGFLESAEMFKDAGYIKDIDGDAIDWKDDLQSQVAAGVYETELERLDNV